MKLAVAGKGGVGKTSLTAWLGDYLARQGHSVWLVDADTATSLGASLGLDASQVPPPLASNATLIQERVGGGGVINLNPEVDDLPERLSVQVANMRLLVMGSIAGAGAGCACSANTLLKALLWHLMLERDQWVLVDLEAGVEHLGRGTVEGVDGLIVVSEPSARSLGTAASIARLATELGITRQRLVLNRAPLTLSEADLPALDGLPPLTAAIPMLPSLEQRQLADPSVLNLPEQDLLDSVCFHILYEFNQRTTRQ